MYEDNTIDIDTIIASAEEYVIKNDRKTNLPILRTIEEFIANQGTNKIIIGGQTGIYALCGNPIHSIRPDLWTFELFSEDIGTDMKSLLKYVTQKAQNWNNNSDTRNPEEIYSGDYRTIILRTVIPNREYMLQVDYRIVAVGKSLGERLGVSIIKVMRPVIGNGPFAALSVAIMPRELQIMRICRMLCMPNFSNDWVHTFIPLLCKLFQLETPDEITGGRFNKHSSKKPGDRSGEQTNERTNERSQFSLDNAILIGERAVSYYTGVRIPQSTRIQYICSFDGLQEYANREHMTISHIDLRLPDDFRLRKKTLHGRNDQIAMDLFNQISYEPAPVNNIDEKYRGPDKIKMPKHVAGPFNVLRFLFIDIWALSTYIETLDDAKKDVYYKRQQVLYNYAIQLWKWILNKCPINVLFPTKYIGVYESENIAKRKTSSQKESNEPRQMSVVAKKDLIELRDELIDRMKFI